MQNNFKNYHRDNYTEAPPVRGRTVRCMPDDYMERSSTKLAVGSEVGFFNPGSGEILGMLVEIFLSTDDEDRGGVVIRAVLSGAGTGEFIPYACSIPNGVELHLAGEQEARALVAAFRDAMSRVIFAPPSY